MRKHYLDNIRWFTVVLVLLYHVLYMYNGAGVAGGAGKISSLDVQYYDVYLYAVYPWFMLILFMVSGISSRCAIQKQGDKAFLKSRTRRLLVPSTIGLFVFQFIQGYVSMALSNAFDTMEQVPGSVKYFIMVLSGTGVLWYIQLLWLFSLLLVLVRKIEKDRLWKLCEKTRLPVILLLGVVVFGAAQILNTPVVVVYRFGLYGTAFFLGYFLFSHENVVERLANACYYLIISAVGLGALFCIRYFGENYADKPVNRSLLYVAFAYITCLAILGGAKRFADFENSFTRWMSAHSFGLYVFHYLGISLVALYIAKAGIIPAVAVYILSVLAGFAAGYGLYAVISRIPFLRWAVLGIKKEKANVSR